MCHPYVHPGIRQRTCGHTELEGGVATIMIKPGTENVPYTGAAGYSWLILISAITGGAEKVLEATDMGNKHCYWLFLCP